MPIQEDKKGGGPDVAEDVGASEGEFRAIFELSPVGMAQVSARTGRFIRVNRKYCERTGYLSEELANLTPADITYIDDRAGDLEANESMLRGEISLDDREKRYVCKDGTIIWVHANATLLRDAQGQPDRSITVVQDITQRKLVEQEREGNGKQFRQINMNITNPTVLHAQDDTTVSDVTEQKRAEQALLESRQFTRSVLDNLFAFVGVVTPDGILIEANRPPLEAAGISASEVIGKNFWDCYWWSYSTEVQAQVRDWCRQVARGDVVRCDVQVRMAGDTRVWIDFQLAPLRDADGHITHLIPSGMDVSGRREAEQTINRQIREMDALYATTPAGLFHFDAGLRFVRVNAWMAAINGRAIEEHIGRTVSEVLHPASASQVEGLLREILRTGEPVLGLEIHGMSHAGAGERDWLASYYALRAADGEIVGVHGVVLDITERKQVEQDLRENEERFRSFADSIPQLAWIADAGSEGMIGWFNKVWLDFTGTTQEQMKGLGWESLNHPDHIDRVVQKFVHHVKHSLDWEDTFPLRGKDGRYRWFLSRMKCIRDDEGNVVQIFGTNTDITRERELEGELRQAAADLSEAHRRKDEFLATLAHELRNPLAPIRSGLQLMKLSGGQHETVEQARAMMERQLTHMVRLVDDLMDASRISQGKLELRRQPISLNAVLKSAVESSGALIEQKRHQLTVKLPAQPLLVDADLTRLAQVFQNLLNNAAKYSEQGGQIHLTVDSQGSDATVTIKDSGVGIATDQLPRIFEMFTQLDRSLDMSQGGLGIGLSLVKRLIDMHGGRVEARSGGLGQGSEFVVTLPLIDQSTHHGASGVDEAQSLSQSPLRILVVDDNRDGADSLSEMLGLMGNDTRTGYDGEQAVSIAGEYRPDVILLDIGLPKLNGYEACRRIRQQPWSKKIVLIAVTGWGQDKDRSRTHEAGFDHHLVKPVDPQELMSLLAGLDVSNSRD